MDFYDKYIKYKNKYLILKNMIGGKQLNNDELYLSLNNFFNIVTQNDLYKQIYNKFYYLPLKNNIQIILKYYPHYSCDSKDYCMIKYKNNYNMPYNIIETDIYNDKYYYRANTHLHDMLKDDYIDYITVDNNKIYGKNIIPKLEWKKYIICPTIDPVHINHLLLIRKDFIRAHQFYFPSDDVKLLNDMFEFNRLTGYYIYNSIELGSIPEVVHFHTSNESPPLDNITNINKSNLSIYSTNFIKLYKVNFNCYNSYYIELSNDFIGEFIKVFPKILYESRYIDDDKYMAQIFICPYKYNFYRVVITFRKVKKYLTIPNNGYYSEEYYNQLFGKKYELCFGKSIGYTDTLRFNILGYEPIIINYEPYEKNFNDIKAAVESNDYSIVNSCLNKTSEFLKDYCQKIFVYNQVFEETFKKEFNKISFNTQEPLYDSFKLNRIIFNIDDINKNKDKYDYLFMNYDDIELNLSINKSSLIKYVSHNNKLYQSIQFDNDDSFINHIITNKILYNMSKLFSTKIYDIGKNKVYYKYIKTDLNTFLDEEEIRYGFDNKKNYSNVFFLMLLYQIYVLYKNGYVFENFESNNIFICNDLSRKDYLRIELGFKLDKKIIIDYKDGKYNFYGHKPIILNVKINKLNKSNNVDGFIKSIDQLCKIFIHSDISKNITKDNEYPEIIFNFIDKIGNDYLNEKSSITFDNIDIINTHK